jgi:PAS domain S-box-containing protein
MNFQRLRHFLWGTIRGRLIVSTAVVQAATLAFIVFTVTTHERDLLLKNRMDEASALSHSLATSAAGWIAANDLAGLKELVDEQQRYPELEYAFLADESGRVLAHTDPDRVGMIATDLPPVAVDSVISRSASLVDVAVPAILGRTHVGWARVGIGQRSSAVRLSELERQGALYALGAILFGSCLAYMIGWRATRRLYAVQGAINRVKQGDASARSGLTGDDEAASIASEFNAMLDAKQEDESALRTSSEEIHDLYNNAPCGYHSLDREGRIVRINDTELQWLGYAREEVEGKKLFVDLVTAEGRKTFARSFPQFIQQGEVKDLEYEFVRKDGTFLHVLLSSSAHFDDAGNYLMSRAVLYDISERKRIEKELKEQEKQSQSLLRLSKKLEAALTYREAINASKDEVREIIGYRTLWVYLFSPGEEVARVLFADGPVAEKVMGEKDVAVLTIKGDPMLEEIARQTDIVVVDDARTDVRTNKAIVEFLGNRTIVNVPIILHDTRLGSVGMGSFGEEGVLVPTPSQQEYLRALASHLAVTVDRLQLLEERREWEAAQRRLNRELRAISDCNETLLRAREELTLLVDVCRIVCEKAGYRMAWVGFGENDERKSVRPVAWAGVEEGYLAKANFTSLPTERGLGPTGIAAREGKSAIIQDFVTEPAAAPWRDAALERGYRSNLVMPLRNARGEVFGVFGIYSTDPGIFTSDEVRLLEELAGDLAYGITALRAQSERDRAEAQLRAELEVNKVTSALARTLVSGTEGIKGFGEITLRYAREITGSEHGFVSVIDPVSGSNVSYTLTAMMNAECQLGEGDQRITFPVGPDGRYPRLWGQALNTRKPFYTNSPQSEASYSGTPAGHIPLRNFLAVPALFENRLVGEVALANSGREYTEADVQNVERLANLYAVAVSRAEAEESLRASEERFSAAFRHSPIGVVMFRLSDGIITDANEVFLEMIGYSREDVVNHSTDDLHLYADPQDRGRIQAMLDTRGGLDNFEFRLCRKSGDVRTVLNSARMFDLGGGKYFLSSLIDITDRRVAEEKLQKANELNRAIIEAAPVAIVDLDLDGKVRSVWNPAAEKMLGWGAEEAIGSYLPSVPLDKEEEFRRFREAIRSGKNLDGVEVTRAKRDGTPIDYSIYGSPLHDTEGRIVGNVAVLVDITQRKRAEQERLAHLRYFECMDKVNRGIQSASDLQTMMSNVLEILRATLDCDRAFLVYPCNPTASSWRVPMERAKPEYPGAQTLGRELPMSQEVADSFVPLLATDDPVRFGPGTPNPLPAYVAEQFGFKCYMAMALHPNIGAPWEYGIHQCSHARDWTDEEERLFKEVGRRLTDGLSAFLSYGELRESKEKLEEAQMMAHVGSWDRDLVTNRITLSAEACRIFGLGDREVVLDLTDWHNRWLGLIHAADRDAVAQAVRDAIEGTRPYCVDYRILRPSGEMRFVHSEANVTRDESGRVLRMLGMMQDVTQSKLNIAVNTSRLHLIQFGRTHSLDEILEETLNEAEKLTGSVIGFYHFVDDDQVTLSLQNWSTRTKADFCRAEGKGLHYTVDKAGVWVECMHRRQPVIHNDYASLPNRRGLPAGHAEVIRELVVPVMRGEKIVAILGTGNKPSDYDEKDVEMVSLLADLAWEIVERKKAELAVLESETKLRRIVDTANEGIWVLSPEGITVSVNSRMAEILGYEPLEMVGRAFSDFMYSEDLEDHHQKMANRRNGVAENYERRLLRKSGETVWTQISATPVFDQARSFEGSFGMVTDTTTRKLAVEEIRRLNLELEKRVAQRTAQLEAANSELEAFSYSVSHDLRAPLRGIDGFSQLLLEQYHDRLDDNGREYLERVRAGAQRMAQLIDDMLNLSRVSRGDMTIQHVDLSNLAQKVAEDLKAGNPKRDVDFKIQRDVEAMGDGRLLRIVLENLLSNAWKYTSKHPQAHIEFGARWQAGEYAFFVRDDGAGFDMQYADKLFGAFQRLHSSKDFPGTGVGLATVHRIINRHGGRVWAEGIEGQGATFYFTIP